MLIPLLDDVDLRILQCLVEDSRRTNKQIGALVHLTGQAVGARVKKLRDLGVIEGYTILWNPAKLGLQVHAFITVFMNSAQAHQRFKTFLQASDIIVEAHRVGGDGCYWLRAQTRDSAELNLLLEQLLQFGNYKLSLSIERLK
ncbi:Lrp/AsnC family transcriptional regulator [Paenibacillus sp. CAU 1782]